MTFFDLSQVLVVILMMALFYSSVSASSDSVTLKLKQLNGIKLSVIFLYLHQVSMTLFSLSFGELKFDFHSERC